MKNTYKFTLKIPNLCRERVTEKDYSLDDIRVWEDVAKHYSDFDFVCSINKKVSIAIDWMPLLKRLKKLWRIDQKLDQLSESELTKLMNESNIYPRRCVEIKGRINIIEHNKTSEYRCPQFILEDYLYDLFLMMNIASPGICDFYCSELKVYYPEFVRKLKFEKISGYSFESIAELFEKQGLNIFTIDFVSVKNWYERNKADSLSFAETSVQKALFSIFHMFEVDCSQQFLKPLLIFNALEALFDTKTGINITMLVDRGAALLALSSVEKDSLRKELKKLYRLRSIVSHGEYKLYHPLNSFDYKAWADRVHKETGDFEFGLFFLIRCIRKLVEKNWNNFSFETRVYVDN